MNNLPGFDLSDEDMYQIAISQPLDVKVKKAVELLKDFGNKSILAFSGGKDSVVIEHLAREAKIEYTPIYSVTTIDPPELVRFIKSEYPHVAWSKPEMHMLECMVRHGKGLPTRLCRWCCEKYKENTGNGHTKIIGVRAAESLRRKGMWKTVNANRKSGVILAPIVYWTDDDVWNYILGENIPYCRLYDEGFQRLGCIGCPLAGSCGQAKEFARWPRYKDLWFHFTKKFWNRWHGVPTNVGGRRFFEDFKSPTGYFDWWLSGKAKELTDDTIIQQTFELYGEMPCDSDCQSRFMTI